MDNYCFKSIDLRLNRIIEKSSKLPVLHIKVHLVGYKAKSIKRRIEIFLIADFVVFSSRIGCFGKAESLLNVC